MADYNGFKAEWTQPGHDRVDFDHVYLYQCVDLIQQWCYEEYGLPGIYGNAIDYYKSPDPRLATKFDKLITTDLQVGDIVVLRTNGTSGNDLSGYGHIVLADGWQDGSSFKPLEQNGATGGGSGTGNDRVCIFRNIPKSRILCVWRAKANAPAPPTPAPGKDPRIGKILYLHPVPQWSVYRVGQKPNRPERIGYLVPQNYTSGLPAPKDKGLTYRILGVSQYPNTVTIQTSTYGYVDIYVDSDGEII